MSHQELKQRRRTDYGYTKDYRTRWYAQLSPLFSVTAIDLFLSRSDNDMYDHMNNSVYNFL